MQSISPERVFRGNDAWEKALPHITNLTKNPLILGRGIPTQHLRNKILNDLKNKNLNVKSARLNFDELNLKSNKINCLIDFLKLDKEEYLENCFRLENFLL